MVRIAISALIMFGAGFAAPAVANDDSIRLIDSSELRTYIQPAEIAIPGTSTDLEVQKSLLGDVGEESFLKDIQVREPRITPDGFRLGVEINLQDSDPIELRDEISSLYLEGAFGRLQDYESMVAQSSVGLMPSALAFDSDTASISLLSRATALNVDPISLSMATSNPGALTPQYAGVTVGWKKGGGLFGEPAERGIDVSLSSMMMVRGANQNDFSFLDSATLGSEDRVYNFGLNVGYRGFTLMASYLHGESQVSSSYESYDIGLRYDFGAWATSLAVGGYFGSESEYSYANLFDIDRIYSVEVGASYALRPWLRFQGRFQFFDYRTLYGGPVDGLGGTFYLGTSLGF